MVCRYVDGDDRSGFAWERIPARDVFTDSGGVFSGTIYRSLEEYLDNPTGASVDIVVVSHASAFGNVRLNSNNDLIIEVSGVSGNLLNRTIVLRATATIDGNVLEVEATVYVNLIFQAGAGAGWRHGCFGSDRRYGSQWCNRCNGHDGRSG